MLKRIPVLTEKQRADLGDPSDRMRDQYARQHKIKKRIDPFDRFASMLMKNTPRSGGVWPEYRQKKVKKGTIPSCRLPMKKKPTSFDIVSRLYRQMKVKKPQMKVKKPGKKTNKYINPLTGYPILIGGPTDRKLRLNMNVVGGTGQQQKELDELHCQMLTASEPKDAEKSTKCWREITEKAQVGKYNDGPSPLAAPSHYYQQPTAQIHHYFANPSQTQGYTYYYPNGDPNALAQYQAQQYQAQQYQPNRDNSWYKPSVSSLSQPQQQPLLKVHDDLDDSSDSFDSEDEEEEEKERERQRQKRIKERQRQKERQKKKKTTYRSYYSDLRDGSVHSRRAIIPDYVV
jgi:2-cysteine adaptor domain